MSTFSEILNNLKEEKNIKVQPLARYCEVERSTIYKFLNGKRLPGSIDIVKKSHNSCSLPLPNLSFL